MKKVLFGLTLLASAAAASAYPVCLSFAPSGYCDAMQFDGKKDATWVNYDCGGSNGAQDKAKYKKKAATTMCSGMKGCEPAAGGGWDALNWEFNPKAGTGALHFILDGSEFFVLDVDVAVSEGACVTEAQGGRSTLTR